MQSATRNRRERRQLNERQKQMAARERGMGSLPDEVLIGLLGEWGSAAALAAWDTLMSRERAALHALVEGLSHADGKIRAACALLMDHLGDDRCAEPLCQILKSDPLESVRRCALHSLACQNCKECPLNADVVGPIVEAALNDRSMAVRRRAVQYLVGQKRDARAAAAARVILETETDDALLARARRALEWHDDSFTVG